MTWVWSGCGPAPAPEKAAAALHLSVSAVEQVSKIQSKHADGQFIVVKLELENRTLQDKSIANTDFVIQNKTDNPAEQYQQGPEITIPSFTFTQAYGEEAGSKLLETAVIHPKIPLERYLIFALPQDADLNRYELSYKPETTVIPLLDANTEVTDNRQEADDPEADE